MSGLRCVRALLIGAILALAACGEPPPPTTSGALPALTVELITPQAGALPREVAGSGSVAARERVDLATEVSGLRIAAIHVEVGDQVQAGQRLLELDPRMVQAELGQAQAQVQEAEAMAVAAGLAWERGQSLRPKGLISQSDHDQLRAQHAQAQARVAAAAAARDTLRLRLDYTVLQAPADGVIAARLAEPGQLAVAGAPLLQLIRDGELEWRGEVTERDLALIAPGMPVQVRAPDGQPVQGRVRQVAPTVDPATRRGLVYVQLPEPGPLKAGMFATGEVQVGQVDGLSVPLAAVVLRDGKARVYRVVDGRAVARAVELGPIRGERVEIHAGLQPGESIVGLGSGFLNDGDRVRVAAPAPDVPPATESAAAGASRP